MNIIDIYTDFLETHTIIHPTTEKHIYNTFIIHRRRFITT